jgi:hypothetical protein
MEAQALFEITQVSHFETRQNKRKTSLDFKPEYFFIGTRNLRKTIGRLNDYAATGPTGI